MGKRKRNSVKPFASEKPNKSKKNNPLNRVARSNSKPKFRGPSKKEVNLRNAALTDSLDRQLGQRRSQIDIVQQKVAVQSAEKPAPAEEPAEDLDARVDALAETLGSQ